MEHQVKLAFFVVSWTLFDTSLVNPQAHNIPADRKTDVLEHISPYKLQWNSTSIDKADWVPLGNGSTVIGLWVVKNYEAHEVIFNRPRCR